MDFVFGPGLFLIDFDFDFLLSCFNEFLLVNFILFVGFWWIVRYKSAFDPAFCMLWAFWTLK